MSKKHNAAIQVVCQDTGGSHCDYYEKSRIAPAYKSCEHCKLGMCREENVLKSLGIVWESNQSKGE